MSMRRLLVWMAIPVLVLGGLVAGPRGHAVSQVTGTPLALHPLVGSWGILVRFDGQPPLQLPNLATFNADGTVTVATPPQLPNVPGATNGLDFFSAGHGAWVATGDRSAAERFVFLVTDRTGHLTSINTVQASITVDQTGNAFDGTFSLGIAAPGGRHLASLTGTLRGARIQVESATPVASPVFATPVS